MLCGAAALAVPTYRIVPLGLTDLEHTRDDGGQSSSGYQLNETGQAIGEARRFNGGSTDLGSSAWLYDGTTTRKVSPTGGVFTGEDGDELSLVLVLNNAGHVSGLAAQFESGSGAFAGFTGWLYDGASTFDVGFTDDEHTRDDGLRYSVGYRPNEAGQLSGFSSRYNHGNAWLGSSAWHCDGATTRNIGLTDAEHTRNDDYKDSSAYGWLNEAGQEIGYSSRFNGGSVDLGQSAWFYDGATTRIMGFVGSEYTRDDGYRSSHASRLNEAGQVIGDSTRFNGGSADLGRSAWLYDGTTTLNIGLTDSVHTRNDGFQDSLASRLNQAGEVAGVSHRYNGGSLDLGRSAWLYDGTNTVEIGLTDGEHSRNDGYRGSYVFGLNNAGQVIGESRNLDGSNYLGRSAWLYDGTTTRQIGLTDAVHTSSDGYQDNTVDYLNDAGQVVGSSERYLADDTEGGQDAWFYDSALDQTFVLQLSARSDGYAYSNINYLGEDGAVLGNYTLFDALDNEVGRRAFYFTVADGLHDLGSLVEGGLPANGWDWLGFAFRANGQGQILGDGELNSPEGSYSAFLLTPIVPEPSSLAIVLHGILFLYCWNTIGRYRTGCRDLSQAENP
jgi:hypothetical protein